MPRVRPAARPRLHQAKKTDLITPSSFRVEHIQARVSTLIALFCAFVCGFYLCLAYLTNLLEWRRNTVDATSPSITYSLTRENIYFERECQSEGDRFSAKHARRSTSKPRAPRRATLESQYVLAVNRAVFNYNVRFLGMYLRYLKISIMRIVARADLSRRRNLIYRF